jgi:phosphomannomutase/phosphoglucomutase
LVYFCVASWNTTGGVNVTGSHNPPDQNGLKLIGRRAIPLTSEKIQQVYQIAKDKFAKRARQKPGEVTEEEPGEAYLEFIRKYVGKKSGSPVAGYKIVVDCGNGAACQFAPELFQRMGCDVIELFCEMKSIPDRGMDPTVPQNLATLRKRVLETGASLGVAFDGDGDRLGVVGSDGIQIDSEYILIILAREFLRRNPGATVLYDVRCSSNVSKDISRHGGNPYMYKTGHSLIKQEMDRKRILLAGEGSGHIFFGEDYWGVDDAIIAAAELITIVSNSGRPIEAHFADLPKMAPSPEFRIRADDSIKSDISNKVGQELKSKYPVSEVDGARADFGDGWALVRPSNTDSQIIVRAEAESIERVRQILKEVESLLSKYLPSKALDSIREFINRET